MIAISEAILLEQSWKKCNNFESCYVMLESTVEYFLWISERKHKSNSRRSYYKNLLRNEHENLGKKSLPHWNLLFLIPLNYHKNITNVYWYVIGRLYIFEEYGSFSIRMFKFIFHKAIIFEGMKQTIFFYK